MNTKLLVLAMIITLPSLIACSDRQEEAASDETSVTMTEGSTGSESGSDKKQGEPGEGPLEAESGMIEYALDGMQTGKIVKYWRRHGLETAEYHDTSMNMMGLVQTEKKWMIVKPGGIYNIDQAARTATRADNPGTGMVAGMDRDQLQNFGEDMLQQMGKRNGTREIAGKTCELWTLTGMGSEICMWEGIELYMSSDMAGMGMKRTAVKIDTGRVDDKHFELPDDIQVRDVGNPLDWQEQMKRAQEFMPK